MSVIIKDMDKADRCADCQLLQTYQEHPFASVEMWCGVTDERIDNMQMVLPTCPIIADRKTEPQTDTHDIHTETHECVKDTHDKVETMSCQECKWWFTDSLKHSGYCQSLLYNQECRYEPLSDCL